MLWSFFSLYRAEICTDNVTTPTYVGHRVMCPECDTWCPYWLLKKSCTLSKVAYVFDNYGTVSFSVMMSIWGKYYLRVYGVRISFMQYHFLQYLLSSECKVI